MTRTLAALAPAAVLAFCAGTARAQELQPPPPMAPGSPQPVGQLPSSPGPTNADDESQDSGLGLEWVWLNADIGASYVNMTSFSASSLGLVQTDGSGLTVGGGIGVRLLFVTLGVRFRNTQLSSLGSLWEIDAEAALHLRVWRIDPYFGVRGGYAFVGSLDSNAVGAAAGLQSPSVSVNGFDVGPMVGIDFYFSHLVSVGAEAGVEFLFLNRPKPALPNLSQLPPDQQMMVQQMIMSNPLYQQSGSSIGLGAGGTAHLGIHF
ncbi:MAG TPA: hypothetical protein VKU41_15615 [Polyangiaceae bacterium]|nr:hypothetical protein [Polyangiaceae bacterium]